jgi:dTDP-4-amino-4,6-dideoxygalactose transaminase
MDVANMSFPVSEYLSERVLSLPFHPYLSDGDIGKIVQAILNAIENEMMEDVYESM